MITKRDEKNRKDKNENDTEKISCDFDVIYYPARAKNFGGLYYILISRFCRKVVA